MTSPFILDWYEKEKRMLLSDDPKVREEGAAYLLDKAVQGDPDAQAIVGEGYYYGDGFERNYEKAFYWCKKASIIGKEYSLILLGKMYENGQGVPQDYCEAVRCYKKEIASGSTFVQDELDQCLNAMNTQGISLEEPIQGLPKAYMEAYEEWFLEDVKKKRVCEKPENIGDYFYRGQFSIKDEGKTEPILWRVIGKDGEKLLAVSEYCIHWLPYNYGHICIWKNSVLQCFMKELYETAFTEDEQALIVKREDSEDHLFVLSIKEAKQYFSNNHDRKATATPYAVLKGAHIVANTGPWELQDKTLGPPHGVCWWLRDRAFSPSYAADVFPDGWICDSGDDLEEAGGVRPAMWIYK